MNRSAIIMCVIFFTVRIMSANVGPHLSKKPDGFFQPYLTEAKNINVEKEYLILNFYEENDSSYCEFTATYYYSSEIDYKLLIKATFYTMKTDKISIKYNDKKVDEIEVDDDFKYMDSIYNETTKLYGNPRFNREIFHKNFCFEFLPGEQNVLQIKGIAKLKGYKEFMLPAIASKHPVLNSKALLPFEKFTYYLYPIKSWGDIGDIKITVNIPNKWNYEVPDTFHSQKKVIESNDEFTTYEYIYSSYIPDMFNIKKKNYSENNTFFPGGINIGFSNQKGFEKYKLGWEFGFYHCEYLNTLLALDYETDFKHYKQFTPTLITSSFVGLYLSGIGLGAGIPIRYENKKLYLGARLRFDYNFMYLFNINFTLDYIPDLNVDRHYSEFYGINL